MLKIDNLKVSADGETLLKGVDLNVQTGTVHAIMGAERLGEKHPGKGHCRGSFL